VTELTEAGRQALADIADRHGVSLDAVEHVFAALIAGQGSLAQFNHPDLGGMGQWSKGGMTMVGDMFNTALKAKVDAICTDVAELMSTFADLHVPSSGSSQSQSQGDGASLLVRGGSSGHWWPAGLGHASSSGSQNRMRYAWFPETRRLAIDAGDGRVRVYDAGDHRFAGFSQQQSGDQSLSFTSQHGTVSLSQLREIDMAHPEGEARPRAPMLSDVLLKRTAESGPADDGADPTRTEPQQSQQAQSQTPDSQPSKPEPPAAEQGTSEIQKRVPADGGQTHEEADIFAKIERLAGLHAKGILTDAEYQAKKAELLARI
tara:strand:- start:2532 stop:3485 length:954 start_codon:yes stop_codon:yes gene_type:complete